MEQKCCSLLTFTVISSNEEIPILLELTGNEEVKAFLRNDIQKKIDLIAQVNEGN